MSRIIAFGEKETYLFIRLYYNKVGFDFVECDISKEHLKKYGLDYDYVINNFHLLQSPRMSTLRRTLSMKLGEFRFTHGVLTEEKYDILLY